VGCNKGEEAVRTTPILAARAKDSQGKGGFPDHLGGNPGAILKSISHRCYLFEVAFVWELVVD